MIDASYLERIEQRIAELEAEMAEVASGGHNKRLRGLVAEHGRLKHLRDQGALFLRLSRERDEAKGLLESGDPDLQAMAEEEIATLDEQLPVAEKALRVALLPPDPDDQRNVLMEIRAGTGGEEAALFAGDLYRMYARFAEEHGWKTAVLDTSSSSVGGFKEIVFSVEGDMVYRVMRYESGVHRVQRVPVTEASGRIHTSAATVAVLAEAEDVDDIDLRTEDLRIDVYRASGAGGQHVNTTDSAVRITHLPTGVVTQSQEERSQHRNRDKAMRMLKAKLLDVQRQEEAAREADARRSQIGSGDRSERIRTYNFPQNRVTDHRINLTLYSLDRIMEGGAEDLLTALYDHDVDSRLHKQMEAAASGTASS